MAKTDVHPAWRVVSIVLLVVLMLAAAVVYLEGGTMAIRVWGTSIPAWIYFPLIALVLFGQVKALIAPKKANAPAPMTAKSSEPAPAAPADTKVEVAARAEGRPVSGVCHWCSQQVAGTALELDAWAGLSDVGRGDLVGHECPACGALSHATCKGSGVVFSTWSGFSKSRCGKCQTDIPKPRVVLPTEKARATVAQKEDAP